MKKTSFLLGILTTLVLSAPAFAAENPAIAKARALADAAREHCHLPGNLAPYELQNFERYVGQVVFPELKMLNLAFVRSFNVFSSSHLPYAYCVITFVGIPNDAYWEKTADFHDRATRAGSLAERMFVGYDDAGGVLLAPMQKRN